jgi:hypothetical protein
VANLIASRRFESEKVTAVAASWEDAPQDFLEDTTKVGVHQSSGKSRANGPQYLMASRIEENVKHLPFPDGF